jgi:hypothetical protein
VIRPPLTERGVEGAEGLTLDLANEPRSAPRSRRRRAATIVLGALLLLLSGALGQREAGIREDETQCEETVAHLDECCPGLNPERFHCEHVVAAGCTGGTEPDFDIELSKKLRGLDCEELRAGNWCSYVPPDMSTGESGGGL